MRAVVTRVNSARVTRAETGEVLGEIGKGFLVLLGVHVDDTEKEAAKIADRICGLRVFDDENGKMNIRPADAGAEILIVSQFTLWRTRGRADPASPPRRGPRQPSRSMSAWSRSAARAGSMWRPASSARRCL